jgi:hypothetical protein
MVGEELSTAIALYLHAIIGDEPGELSSTPSCAFSFRVSFRDNDAASMHFYDGVGGEISTTRTPAKSVARHETRECGVALNRTAVVGQPVCCVAEIGMDVFPALAKCVFMTGKPTAWKVEQQIAFFWVKVGESCGTGSVPIKGIQNSPSPADMPGFKHLPLEVPPSIDGKEQKSFNPSIAAATNKQMWIAIRHQHKFVNTTTLNELTLRVHTSGTSNNKTHGVSFRLLPPRRFAAYYSPDGKRSPALHEPSSAGKCEPSSASKSGPSSVSKSEPNGATESAELLYRGVLTPARTLLYVRDKASLVMKGYEDMRLMAVPNDALAQIGAHWSQVLYSYWSQVLYSYWSQVLYSYWSQVQYNMHCTLYTNILVAGTVQYALYTIHFTHAP